MWTCKSDRTHWRESIRDNKVPIGIFHGTWLQITMSTKYSMYLDRQVSVRLRDVCDPHA